jgi:hypothetical protein
VPNASKCVFSANPSVTGLPKTVSCTSGKPEAPQELRTSTMRA